jgi:ASC-1-like (ASCH) protein
MANQMFEIDCDMVWYLHIVEGKKYIEGRPAKQKYLDLRENQLIKLNASVNGKITDVCTYLRIVSVTKFKSFKEMLEVNGLKNVLPEIESIDEGINVYRKWYSEELEKEIGVVGIKFEVV